MEVDLYGRTVLVAGHRDRIADAVAAALTANGANVSRQTTDEASARATAQHAGLDILVMTYDLRPTAAPAGQSLTAVAAAAAAAMAAGGAGRIVFVLSALGVIPMRRHPEYSAAMAGTVAAMRTLAMAHGPHVLVNAVATGAIAAPGGPAGAFVAGGAPMLSHVPLGRAGTLEDVAAAVLFLCDPLNSYMTGQLLIVDGGWSAGYGRNF